MKTNAKKVSREIDALAKSIHIDGIFNTNLAAQSIKKGITQSIGNRKKITGQSRGRLRASTIKSKRKKRSKTPLIPLSDQGIMRNVNKTTATLAKPKSILTPAAERSSDPKGFDIASHHQEGDLGPWFGVSPEAQKDVNRLNAEIGKTAIIKFNQAK